MLTSFLLPLLAVFSFLSCVAAQSAGSAGAVCSASQYSSLSCLASHNGAASLCSKLPRQTATLTVTTTTLHVDSITLTAHATSQTTVYITSTQMSTVYVTRGPVATVITYKTNLSTETATVTTFIPTAKIAGAAHDPTCNPEHAVSSLGHLLPGVLATACSCIGHPARTTTVTSVVEAPAVNTRTTEFAGTAPTTTIYEVALKTTTVTEHPTKFITQTTESCTTSTVTVSYAAPQFTQAFGPKAGCIDTASKSSKILPHNVHDLHSATQQCKSLCAQNASCAAVYVQHMRFMRVGPQHYHCFFNDKQLNADSDLQCSKSQAIYGLALGYDANGRGTKPL